MNDKKDRMKYIKWTAVFVCASLLIVYALFYNGIEYMGHKEAGDSVEVMVRKLIKIEYGFLNHRELKNIATEEFRNNLEDWFYKGIQPYMICDDFMRSFRKDWEGRENKMMLCVTIEDVRGLYYQFIIFDILPDGRYLISEVQNDI